MSAQRLAVTGLMIIALLAPGASLAQPASKADSASGMPAGDAHGHRHGDTDYHADAGASLPTADLAPLSPSGQWFCKHTPILETE